MAKVVVTFDDGKEKQFDCYRPDAGFEDDTLVVTSDCQVVFVAPQHTVRCVQVLLDQQREIAADVAPPEPAITTPDPGPGYRLIDKAVDKPQEGDEYISILPPCGEWRARQLPRLPFSTEYTYRRRVTPEPVCKREAFSGGGSPSPRECGVCGEGPCEKKPVESPDDWVTQDRVPYRREFDECRWYDYDVWHSNQDVPDCYRHGYIGCGALQHKLQVRCRRKDLPSLLPTTPSIGDTVIVQMPGDEWNGCKRTVIAKLPSDAFVVSRTGEPLSRLYDAQHLRVVPKREESTNG